MIYTFSRKPDLSTDPPDLHLGLVMLLVDGRRDADAIVAASPMEDSLTREILLELRASGVLTIDAEAAPAADVDEPERGGQAITDVPPAPATESGVWVNPKRKKKPEKDGADEEDEAAAPKAYLSWPILQRDPKYPDPRFLSSIPALTGEVDPAEITGDASEYYLLSRIDGSTSVESLQTLTSMSMALLVRRLAKHTASGAVSFPEDIHGEFLGSPNGDLDSSPDPQPPEVGDPASTSDGSTAGSAVAEEAIEDITIRMVDDPSIAGPLRRTGASMPSGGFQGADLTQKECLVLSLVQSETTLGELASQGPGDSRALLISVLGLYRRGYLLLAPPDRAPRPKKTPVPGPSPVDEPMEIEFTSGEFSSAEFQNMLAGEATDDDTLEELDRPLPAAAEGAEEQPSTTPEPGEVTPIDDARSAAGPESTDNIMALPAILLRGKERPGYEKEWVDPSSKGEIADVTFEKLFSFINSTGRTGVLHVRRGKEQRNVWFASGTPVYATSTEAEDMLGSLLYKTGTFDKQTYLQFERERRKAPEREGWEVLEEALLVLPDELLDGRRHQLVHIVARLFHANTGQYQWVGKLRLQSDLAMLSVEVADIRAMISEVAPRSVTSQLETLNAPSPNAVPPPGREFTPSSTATPQPTPIPAAAPKPAVPASPKRQHPKSPSDWIGENLDFYVLVPDEAVETLRDLRLGEKERRYVDAISESRYRLRELMAMSSLGRTRTHQFLAALWSKNLFDFSEEVDREDEAVRNLETIDKWLVRVETGDLFHAIGTHVSATLGDVQASYAKEKERFDKGKFADREPAFRETVDRIHLIMDRAYARLEDTSARREYRMEHFGATRLRTFAEVQSKKAEVFFFFKQDWETARHLYESAWDLEPETAEFLAHMGFCHYKAHYTVAKQQDRGVLMVERALTMADDKQVRVLLTAGLLERERKNSGRQREYLSRARRLVSSDEEFRNLLTSYRLTESQ